MSVILYGVFMKKDSFGGKKWISASPLGDLHQTTFVPILVPRIPKFIETYHLTMLTLLWSIFIAFFGYLAKSNIYWLLASSVLIAIQYVTDAIDGEVGRFRNTGLVRWGYFMDHFLDYIFLNAICLSYFFVMEEYNSLPVLFLLIAVAGYLVNAYLHFSVTNIFTITFLNVGPTELRLLAVILNIVLIIMGPANAVNLFWGIATVFMLGLIVVVFRTQKKIWRMDMANKKKIRS